MVKMYAYCMVVHLDIINAFPDVVYACLVQIGQHRRYLVCIPHGFIPEILMFILDIAKVLTAKNEWTFSGLSF